MWSDEAYVYAALQSVMNKVVVDADYSKWKETKAQSKRDSMKLYDCLDAIVGCLPFKAFKQNKIEIAATQIQSTSIRSRATDSEPSQKSSRPNLRDNAHS